MKTVEINGKRYEPVVTPFSSVLCEICALYHSSCMKNGAFSACTHLDDDLPEHHFVIFKEASENDKD